jgi:ATP-dependent Clp protease ATP-binding subunit ClpA
MEQTTYSVMESFAYDQARKILRPELFNRLTETIVFRPLSQETQISILKQALDAKLAYIEPKLGKLSIEEKSVNAHLLRKCFTQAEGARGLKKELDRQINNAVLPWAMSQLLPTEGKFYSDLKNNRLELR